MVRPLSLLTYLIWALVASVILYDVAPLRGESPVGKQIGEITITGNRVRSRDQILSKMNLRPGAKYDQTMADEDVKRLIQEGWFLPGSVFINTAPRPDGSIQVIVGVREAERTIKEVKYVGNDHIDDEELNKLTGLRPGAPMEPGTNQDARHRIFRKYQDEGRLHTAVVLEEGGKAGDQRVVFRITEGPVVKVRRIRFQFFGERSGVVTTEKLWTLIDSASNPVTPAVGLVTYNETDLNKDEEKIKGHYQKLGFLEASVKKEVVWEGDGSTVEVVYHIWEKGRFKIGEVKIEGAKSFDQQTLLSHTSARPGDYYETRLVGEDLKHIRDFYGYRGMPTQVREVQTHSKDGIVNVTYQVEEREPLRVGNIRVLGNSYTREAVVLRQLNLFPGQLLSYPELLEAQRNLQRLQIFENDPSKGGPPSVEVQDPPPGANNPYRDLVVRVAEADTATFMIGAGVSSDAGVTGRIIWNERNFDITRLPRSWSDIWERRAFRGAGQEFRVEAEPGTVFQRYSVSWREPFFFDQLYSLSVGGYYFQRGYNEFMEDRYGGRITLGRRLTNTWSASLTQRIEGVNVRDIPLFATEAITRDAGSHFITGTRLGVARDTRDDLIRPGAGGLLEVGAEQVYGDYNFTQVIGEGSKFFTLFNNLDGTGRHILAFRGQVGWSSNNTPVFERFYAGGFRSIRGFQFRGVGPFENTLNVGGNFSALASAEYQLPLLASDNLYLVGFLDAGTVERNARFDDIRVTAGFGFRISVPQLLGPVPLALDFGFPLRKGRNDRTQMFQFGFSVAN